MLFLFFLWLGGTDRSQSHSCLPICLIRGWQTCWMIFLLVWVVEGHRWLCWSCSGRCLRFAGSFVPFETVSGFISWFWLGGSFKHYYIKCGKWRLQSIWELFGIRVFLKLKDEGASFWVYWFVGLLLIFFGGAIWCFCKYFFGFLFEGVFSFLFLSVFSFFLLFLAQFKLAAIPIPEGFILFVEEGIRTRTFFIVFL